MFDFLVLSRRSFGTTHGVASSCLCHETEYAVSVSYHPETAPASLASTTGASPAPRWPRWGEGGGATVGLSDAWLVVLVALLLFALAAWPLLLVTLPPFQDLPNHLATAHILAHPDLFPEYVGNGFFKSNSLLALWLHGLGSHGLYGAARVFTAMVLFTTALAWPLFVLRFSGRRHLLVATLFVWPLVHGFFVSMGMLNFVLAFALSLILLTILDRQRERPSWPRGVVIAALACVLWYAHPFPLAVVTGLVALHVARQGDWRARIRSGLALLSPLLPAGLLSLLAAQQHLVKAEGATALARVAYSYLNPWEIVGHLWLDASGAFTYWGTMTIVPALALPYFAWKHRREPRAFYSLPAMAMLALAYVALPVMLSNWWHLNCRLVPFLWAGLALRLPSTLPRFMAIVLATCAVAFSVVLGVDYVRLDRDRAAFTAGMAAVPARATLLPLLFKQSRTSDFTASLAHAWGYYTIEKNTSAPLVFAVERSYPIRYREFPPAALIPPALDNFAERHGTPAQVCRALRQPAADAACAAAWRALWNGFWRQAEPRFSHVLTWAMPPQARAMIPEGYRQSFVAGDLEIYAAVASPIRAPLPQSKPAM